MKRVHVKISGRVQGVAFRYRTQSQADSLGLKGWVRNLSDGRVEAVFEGELKKVEEMVAWCQRGPLGAHVTEVEIVREPYQGEYHHFAIRYDR